LKRIVLRFLSLILLTVQGCTLRISAPAVSPAVVAAGASSDASVDQLNQGRSLFMARCIECHALPVVGAHSVARWRKVLPKMAPRARLQPNEEEAVLAYLVAARQSLGQESQP
jgi:cytochrome c5